MAASSSPLGLVGRLLSVQLLLLLSPLPSQASRAHRQQLCASSGACQSELYSGAHQSGRFASLAQPPALSAVAERGGLGGAWPPNFAIRAIRMRRECSGKFQAPTR